MYQDPAPDTHLLQGKIHPVLSTIGSVTMDVNPSLPAVDEDVDSSNDLCTAVLRIFAATARAINALQMRTNPSSSPPLLPASTLVEHAINLSTAMWRVPELRPVQMQTLLIVDSGHYVYLLPGCLCIWQ